MSGKQKPWEHHEASEEGDEGWLVSYADMVTLLFGFFVILYSMATLDEKKFEQMGENVAEAFKAPETDVKKAKVSPDAMTREARQARALQMMAGMVYPTESTDQIVKKIESAAKMTADAKEMREQLMAKTKEFGDNLFSNKPESRFVELTLPDKILFGSGSDSLSPEAQGKLIQLGKTIAAIPGVERIEVVGHTDSSPPAKTSTYKNNFALSSARAGVVAAALMGAGIKRDLLVVRGMADLEPLVKIDSPTQPAIGRAKVTSKNDPSSIALEKNRRVTLIIRKTAHE
jgi:chemotaxis protein MotB